MAAIREAPVMERILTHLGLQYPHGPLLYLTRSDYLPAGTNFAKA